MAFLFFNYKINFTHLVSINNANNKNSNISSKSIWYQFNIKLTLNLVKQFNILTTIAISLAIGSLYLLKLLLKTHS